MITRWTRLAGWIVVLLALASGVRGQVSVRPDDGRISYLGAWRATSNEVYTIYAGSQLRVRFRGDVKVLLRIPSGTVAPKVKIREVGTATGITSSAATVIPLESETEAEYEINLQSHLDTVFDPASGRYSGCRLAVTGLVLDAGGELLQASYPARQIVVEAVGDSITQGDRILQGSGDNLAAMDGTRSYGYLLARELQARYRVRGLGGESVKNLAAKIPYFQSGIPLSDGLVPAYFLVNIGALDRSLSGTTYRTALEGVLVQIRLLAPSARILVLNFFNNSPSRNASIQQAIQNRAPLSAELFDAQPYVFGFTDGTHPTGASHAALAAALAARIRRDTAIAAVEWPSAGEAKLELDRSASFDVSICEDLLRGGWIPQARVTNSAQAVFPVAAGQGYLRATIR